MLRSSRVCFVWLTALALFLGATNLGEAQQMGRVGGKVTDDDGNPLVGASLVAEQPGTSAKYEATTDEDGRYNINGLRGGDWLITASMDGYLPTQGNFRVTTLSRVPPITFKLEKGVEGPLGALSGVDTTAIQADLQTADLLFNAGQYAAAIASYQNVLTAVPELTVVNLSIANC